MANSNRKTSPKKPRKPYPTFPLFPHLTRRWAKKIRGKLHYFGSWADGPEAALDNYLLVKDRLHAGLPIVEEDGSPPPDCGVVVNELCAQFLLAKENRISTGELKPRTFANYRRTCLLIEAFFGSERGIETLKPADFERFRAFLTQGRGLVALRNEIRNTRIVFRYAETEDLTEKRIKFGNGFAVSEKHIRRQREDKPRFFEAEEIRQLLDKARQPLKSMILLAINCGYGNGDIAQLNVGRIDFENNWITFPRPKNGNYRRCKLWAETLAALREVIPADASKDDLVFVTRGGKAWVRFNDKTGSTSDYVANRFTLLLKALGMHEPGKNFYALRHSHRTASDGANDTVAARLIMGHRDPNRIDDVYRERIDDSRIEAVCEHVRNWLFEGGAK